MKIGLQFRSRLEASGEAGDAALQEFQSLLGALSAWANAQHNDDGGHTDVTAESIELTAIRKAALRVVSGWTDIGAGVAYSGAITPPQLTGDVNNYSPLGVGEAFMIRLTATTLSAIGGLRDGDRTIPLGGRVLALFNAGAETITLTHEEVASEANYRFRLPGFADITLAPNTIALVYYDAKSRRWAILSSTGGEDGTTASEYNAGDSGPNIEIDWANGTQQIVNLTHDADFTFVNGIEGQEYRLVLTEGGAGDFVPDFGAGVIFENDNLKPTAIVAGQVLQVELYYTLLNGGQYFGTYTFPEVEVDLDDDSVTNNILADMAQSTIKGRAVGAGTGDPQDLTATQATAILDVMVGDSGSGGTKGLAPAPGVGDAAAGKYLKADGTYAVPPGSGGATPGGSSGDLQYNNAGAFGGLTPGAGIATYLATPTTANLAAATLGIARHVIAAADESVANDTMQDDDELLFPVAVSSTYIFEMFVVFTTGASNTPDSKMSFSFPASATLTWALLGQGLSATSFNSYNMPGQYRESTPATSTTNGVLTSAVMSGTGVWIRGVLKTGATSGNLQFRFAQNTSTGGTPLVRKADSYIEYKKVA